MCEDSNTVLSSYLRVAGSSVSDTAFDISVWQKYLPVSIQILGQQINDFTLPDVSLVGEHSDAAELGRMLQLILGCAVNCEQKQGNLFEVKIYFEKCN